MIDTIKPGSKVHVKIVKQLTNAAARKTLARVLSKDPVAKKIDRRQTKIRKVGMTSHQRGGRPWEVRIVRQDLVSTTIGTTGTVRATVDVLRDLKSVGRFVEVTPA